MARVSTASLMALLGANAELPQRIRKFRSAAVTLHRGERSSLWAWQPQASSPNGQRAAVVLLDGEGTVSDAEASRRVSANAAGFLHPARAAALSRCDGVAAMCVWVPWDAVMELDDGIRRLPSVIPESPLTVGFSSFVHALLAHEGGATQHSDYLIERLLTEMVFGVLLEASDAVAMVDRRTRPVDHARSLMLLRRGDPSFGVEDLAREMHVSPRHLQRTFSGTNSSASAELRALRVDLARDLLGQELYDALSLDEVAMHSGFTGSAAMRRAFAAMGLPAPGRVRRRLERADGS